MSAVTKAAISVLLREDDVKKEIVQAVKQTNVLTANIKSKKATSGNEAVFNVQLGYSPSAGSRDEFAPLPEAGFGEYDKAKVTLKNLYSSGKVSGPAIAAAENSPGLIRNLVDRIFKDAKDGFVRDRQRQYWSDGSGTLGKVLTAGASLTTIAVTDPYGLSYNRAALSGFSRVQTMVFMRNAKIFIDNPTSPKVITTITGVDPATGTITVSPAVTVDAEAAIYRGESATDTLQINKNREIDGVTKVFGTGGSYLGVSRVGRPEWQAGRLTLGDGKLTTAAMRNARILAARFGVKDQDLILTNDDEKALFEALMEQRHRVVNEQTLAGGFSGLKYDGLTIVSDADCPAQRMYFLRMKDFVRYFNSEIDWIDEGGDVLLKIPGVDGYESTLRSIENLACENPCNQVVLENILSI